jgi:hypothetical protein
MVVNQPIEGATKASAHQRRPAVRGLNDAATAGLVHQMELKDGQWFSDVGVKERDASAGGGNAIQAVLGEGIARQFGRDRGLPSLHVGDEFDLGPSKWVVVGILDSAGSTFDSEVWAAYAQQKFGGEHHRPIVVERQTPGPPEPSPRDSEQKPAVLAKVERSTISLNGTNQQFCTRSCLLLL